MARAKNQIFLDTRGHRDSDTEQVLGEPVEYPKHVTVAGVLHVCLDADHEARVTGQQQQDQ